MSCFFDKYERFLQLKPTINKRKPTNRERAIANLIRQQKEDEQQNNYVKTTTAFKRRQKQKSMK